MPATRIARELLEAHECCSLSFWQAQKQAELNREEEEQKAKAARKEARRAARLAAASGKTHTASPSPSPSPSPAAGATQSWDSNETSLVSGAVDDDKKGYGTEEDEDEHEDDDAAALRASLQLAAELQRAEDLDARVPKRKRMRPEAFIAEPSKQMKAEPSRKEHVRMQTDDTELAADTEAQSEEDDEDMLVISSDDDSLGGELQQPKAKKARRETKPKVLTEVEHAAEVMRPSAVMRIETLCCRLLVDA